MFDWITGFMEAGGYSALFVLMLAENLFPPIPSEVIVPLAGFTAARGDLSFWMVVVVATLGSVVGATFWYFVGRAFGFHRVKYLAGSRFGRIMTVTPREVDDTAAWFARYGSLSVLVGRVVPTVRTLISVPAGIVAMPLVKFLAYSAVGSLAWILLLAAGGYLLADQYDRVEVWVNPVSNAVVGLIVAWYLYRVVTFRADR
jgi:membrane protein DedA with SNARE-associated domain